MHVRAHEWVLCGCVLGLIGLSAALPVKVSAAREPLPARAPASAAAAQPRSEAAAREAALQRLKKPAARRS